MTAPTTNDKSREVRLGIVMYGGVSLAIYIFGVAQELFRSVRGRGVYRLIKAITDSDVVVDVVSGTSAGGINGILLASALCNERELGDVASLWRENGSIADLLRKASDDPAQCTSLLDSEGYYHPQLVSAFRKLGAAEITERVEDPSPIQELDLFITGTDIDGNVYTQFDDAGHAIDVKNHRTVFILKHRSGRKAPFDVSGNDAEITYEALATLARITSCFPAAFAPVYVPQPPAGVDSYEARLREWGALTRPSSFLDGGVLDNKPFSYTIGAIFSRAATREVDRKLLYVEPDPERFAKPTDASRPNALQAVLAALIGIPGYESIAEDLRAISDRNSKLQQYRRLLDGAQLLASSPQRRDMQNADPGCHALYRQSRFVALTDRVVTGLLRSDGRSVPLQGDDRTRAEALVREFDGMVQHWIASGDGASVEDLFTNFDIYVRQRRALRIVYLLHRDFGATPVSGRSSANATVLHAMNRLVKLYEIIQSAMELVVDVADFRWRDKPARDVWSDVLHAFQALLDADGPAGGVIVEHLVQVPFDRDDWLSQDALQRMHDALFAAAGTVVAKVAQNELTSVEPFHSVLRGADDVGAAIMQTLAERDPLREAYATFDDVDARVFPIEMIAGLREKDIIETVRISPADADKGFSANGLSDKVAGDALYHFGGFFKRSWRSNDILWGRLDGLCQVVECLLQPDRIRALGDDAAMRALIRARLDEATLQPAVLFPGVGDMTQAALRRWLDQLFDDRDVVRRDACEPGVFTHHRNLLIEAAQLDVLRTDLPIVLGDALQEQASWNIYRGKSAAPDAGNAPAKFDRDAWSFVTTADHLDPFVAMTAAAEIAADAFARPDPSDGAATRPSETTLGRFFRKSYRVGAEQLLRDVPKVVLLDLLATALLATRNCFLNVLGSHHAERMQRNFAYQLFVNAPLRAFKLAIALARGVPSARTPLKIAALALPVVAMVAGTAMQWHTMAAGLMALGAFVVLPLAVIWFIVTVVIDVPSWHGRRRAPATVGPPPSRSSPAAPESGDAGQKAA